MMQAFSTQVANQKLRNVPSISSISSIMRYTKKRMGLERNVLMQQSWVIAVDLDGTLLRSDQTISAANRQALQMARELGHTVVIATGRPLRTALPFHQELGLTTPLITLNGGMIWSPQKDMVLSQTVLSTNSLYRLTKLAEIFDGYAVLAEAGTSCYQVTVDHLVGWPSEMKAFFEAAVLNGPFSAKAKLWPEEGSLPEAPNAVLLSVPRENHETFFVQLAQLGLPDIQWRSWRSPHSIIEIIASGVSKATAIQYVMNYLSMEQTSVMAFGDEMNDVAMLQFADRGIAMGNANSLLLPHANDVTATNEEDGVAGYLQQFLQLSLRSSSPST